MVSIDVLPDDVLLHIFDTYRHENLKLVPHLWAWKSLIHVCRRWRRVVFGSPRRLDLRLLCRYQTRSRDMLDIWPALPLIIHGNMYHSVVYSARSVDNIVAALECTDRVCFIKLRLHTASVWEIHLAAMQQPFPKLTHLYLDWIDEIDQATVVPDSFLGGSAPRLESLKLYGVPFPGMPKLLLSTTHLVHLLLSDIPHSGYISPEAMVAALSTLTSLEYLTLTFESPESCPDLETRRLPPSARSVLPVLRFFQFKGVTEYLEDLVTDFDAPQLNTLNITFSNDIVFDTPQLIRFISRTPMLGALEKAVIIPNNHYTGVTFGSRTDEILKVFILCKELDWQLSSLEQVCTSFLPFLSTLKGLYFRESHSYPLDRNDNIENSSWLGLLHSFTTVKNLYICKKVARYIGPALQELVEGRTTEVFPTLENIFLEGLEPSGPVQEGIGHFVAARQVVGHRIAVSDWADPYNVW